MIVLALVLIFNGFDFGFNSMARVSDAQLHQDLQEGKIKEISITPIKVGTANMGDAVLIYQDGAAAKTVYVSDIDHFREEMSQNYQGVIVTVETIEPDSIWSSLLPMVMMTVILGIIMLFIWARMQGGGGSNGKMMNFGKSRAQVIDKANNPIRFANVAGLEEEKEEMKEVVDFLRSPQRFVELGARIPKGVLLVGPPGTGKTYLAKAVAGEAGVPFFSISGSDFVEMFVGVGASRVRDLFEKAKKSAPSIVFIDEIDAVGRQRGAGLGGGHDEREQTLNQLLVEMDGFGVNYGVIVIAATNRVDILDPALLRPGRFDRQVVVGRPDVKGREEVLRVHSKTKPLGEDVDLKTVAQTTAGFTPADLENLLNEAAIFAARGNRHFITMEDVQKAFIKVGVGTEKKSRVISAREKNITAIHEAGHAILHHVLPGLDPVHSISIIPTGMAGGYTMPLPEEDTLYWTKSQMELEIVALLGGRVAEELEIGDVTTGASNDIQRATSMARGMVMKYGMSDKLGLVQLGEENEEVFLGRDIGHTRNYGEDVAATIDGEIRRIIEEAHQKATALLTEYHDVLLKTRDLLLKQEKVTGEEFASLFNSREPQGEGAL
ncbi:MAG: ATP-dependent zinc metalloprotease FtsH [Lachnospiraceae bacterium]|nr:ATP-dependent zinc metalloprotease FtsH [Lachnospiraceae bacterium]